MTTTSIAKELITLKGGSAGMGDMASMLESVQRACDMAKNVCSRLCRSPLPRERACHTPEHGSCGVSPELSL